MIHVCLTIILVFIVQDGHRENCFGYDVSSKVGTIDLLGSRSPRYPPQYVLKKNVSITQFLYNTCGQPEIKFKPIKENIIYNFLEVFSSIRLQNYLTDNGITVFRMLALLMLIKLCMGKYRKMKNRVLTLENKVEEQHKDIGRLNSCLAQQNEKIIRHDIEKMKDFGSDFAQGAKIASILHAVQHVLERSGENLKDLGPRVILIYSKVRDFLRPNNDTNCSEFVTGIQKEILIWYLKGVRGYKNSADLEHKLKQFPWVGEDGKLSLGNVRKCIRFVHKNLKQTLAFLAQTIDWDDLNSFISSRPKKNKGKAKGHGFYFLMYHFYAEYCKEANVTAHEQLNLFSFPPSGEIELDAQGRIETGIDAIKIKIGEMKISKEKIPEAKKQLKRSLIFFAGLHKFVQVNDGAVAPIYYDLTGYIFISGGTNVIKNEELPLPPLGKISYITFNS